MFSSNCARRHRCDTIRYVINLLRKLAFGYLWLQLIYLLIVILGAFALYWFMPQDVIDAIKNTYFSDNPGGM